MTYSSMVCRNDPGGFSTAGNFSERNASQFSSALRYIRDRSSPCTVAFLYISSALAAWCLFMSKKRSMSLMTPSLHMWYHLNESLNRSLVAAMTTSLAVRESLIASQSMIRRIMSWQIGSLRTSSSAGRDRIWVSEPVGFLLMRAKSEKSSQFATNSSRYDA